MLRTDCTHTCLSPEETGVVEPLEALKVNLAHLQQIRLLSRDR